MKRGLDWLNPQPPAQHFIRGSEESSHAYITVREVQRRKRQKVPPYEERER